MISSTDDALDRSNTNAAPQSLLDISLDNHHNNSNNNWNDETVDNDFTSTSTTTTTTTHPSPLDEQILDLVTSSSTVVDDNDKKYYQIKPGRISTHLGLSIEDATAELCGLLAAVGGGQDGASFQFERTIQQQDSSNNNNNNNNMTMVFLFPTNVRKIALRYRRKENVRQFVFQSLQVVWKGLKIMTAFGLILSLFLLTIAAVIAIIAGIVAMSTQQQQGNSNSSSHQQRHVLLRQLRTLFYTVRQALWCYALFGQQLSNENDQQQQQQQQQQDPYMTELAYDMALVSSICCVNPGSFFWWYRVSQLQRRRQRMQRGWGRERNYNDTTTATATTTTTNNNGNYQVMDSDIEGVRLIRRGDENEQQQQQHQQQQTSMIDNDQRGLLSIAVEYLFGPSPFVPGPNEADIWKLRATAIVQLSSDNRNNNNSNDAATADTAATAIDVADASVSLQQLSPYMDHPPSSIYNDPDAIVQGGLPMVAHFNGIPAAISNHNNDNDNNNNNIKQQQQQNAPHMARFFFPELLAESSYLTRYNNNNNSAFTHYDDDDDNDTTTSIASWSSLLCAKPTNHTTYGRNIRTGESSTTVPAYLYERLYKFTHLPSDQFLYCVFLGVLNLVGTIWLKSSLINPGGLLYLKDGTMLATIIKHGLVRVLLFYAILFFTLPSCRLVLIVVLNRFRKQRNRKRQELASALASKGTSHMVDGAGIELMSSALQRT